MSIAVMTAVWAIDLPDSQKIVLLALADCANDEGLCWPSMATLAKKCSKGQRTVQGVIKELVSAGHLSREEVMGRGCKYLVHPRSGCAPAKAAPRRHRTPPPQGLRDTPAAAADKPSKNHQEPSEVKPACAGAFTFGDFEESWNEVAARRGLPRIVKSPPRRRKAFADRKREFPEIEHWRNAFRCLDRTDWLHGQNDRGWRADPDFFLQSKSFTKLVEGSYGQAN